MELNTLAMRGARASMARHTSDTGSSEVQGAHALAALAASQRRSILCRAAVSAPLTFGRCAVSILTQRILYMTEHLKGHPKDKHSRLGLMGMLSHRKKLLQYLRRKDGDRYANVLSVLGLKDKGW